MRDSEIEDVLERHEAEIAAVLHAYSALKIECVEELRAKTVEFSATERHAAGVEMVQKVRELRAALVKDAAAKLGDVIAGERKTTAKELAQFRAAVIARVVVLAETGDKSLRSELAEKSRVISEAVAKLAGIMREMNADVGAKASGEAVEKLAGSVREMRDEFGGKLKEFSEVRPAPASAVSFLDFYKGTLTADSVYKRGQIWSYAGGTYMAQKDGKGDLPSRVKNALPDATWAVIAAPGYGSSRGLAQVMPVAVSAPYAIGTILPAAQNDGGTWLQTNGQVVAQSSFPALFKITGHQPQFSEILLGRFAAGNTNSAQAVAFGGGVYVFVGTGGKITTCTSLATGTTLTAQTSGTANQLNAIAFGANVFVAVGASNTMLSSPDGATWTSRTATGSWNFVYFINNKFIALGNAGVIGSSSDGVTWSVSTVNTTAWNVVLYDGTKFFASLTTATNAVSASSADAVTWAPVAAPSSTSIFSGMTSGGKLWWEDQTNDTIYFSTNQGTSFSTITGAAYFATNTGAAQTSGYVLFDGVSTLFRLSAGAAPFNITTDAYTSGRLVVPANYFGLPAWGVLATKYPQNGFTAKFYALIDGTTAGVILASVDGVNWTRSNSIHRGTVGTPQAKGFYQNGYYFVMPNGTNNGLYAAPEPYDPALNFQIPTRTDAGGTALFVKAL